MTAIARRGVGFTVGLFARRGLQILAIAIFAVAGWLAYTWVRDSDLVAVNKVTIKGVHGQDSAAIRQALKSAAGEMTTLNVDEQALRAAVRDYPVVKSVSASAGFPHDLTITVHQYQPAAVVSDGGKQVAVADDGTLLPRVRTEGLPSLKAAELSSKGKLSDRRALGLVALLSQAPESLRPDLGHVYWGKDGIRVALENGPTILFGGPAQAQAKWRAAVAVLADESSTGADMIDVRVPNRPVAGGFAPGTQGTASELPPATNEDGTGATDPTVATDPNVAPTDTTTDTTTDPQL